MARFHNIDNVRVPFTPEEETARDVEEQAHIDNLPIREMAGVRHKRDALISETDFYALSDATTMSDEMKVYRQALRDFPATYSADKTSQWPTKPA